MNNIEIAELLRDVAAAYQLENEKLNKFKIIAYQRAADAVEHLSSEARDLWEEGKLKDVAGIGPGIHEHLDELFRTGKSKHFNKLLISIPKAVFELMKVPGIGVKTATKLVKEFKINDKDPLKYLQTLAESGKIRNLEGFGETSESSIIKSISEYKKKPPERLLLPYAEEVAGRIIDWMKKGKGVVQIDSLGSLRRKASTIGDLDFAAAANSTLGAIDHFTKYPQATRVLEKGERSASIIIPGNIRVDIIVSKPKAYGALLQHFTGSKHHNVALREYALKKNLSLSDYGIYTKPGDKNSLKEIATEQEFYEKYLKMDWIPPEIREDAGEIELALNHKIPILIELKDIKGDLQIHSDFDIETSHDVGVSSMAEILEAANKLNYEYIAFTEHNPSKSKHNEQQIIDILKRKREKVNKLNYSITNVKGVKNSVKKVFNSLEIDILPDGKLPVPEKGLETLDFALVSIHSSFDLEKEVMTKRILSALSTHPKVKIFAHPTGRKLNDRPSIDADWNKIFDYAKDHKIYLEINGDPARLDLPDVLVHEGIKHGVKFSMGTDSHSKDGLTNMRYGIYVARRGWATKSDIINTLSLVEIENFLEGGD